MIFDSDAEVGPHIMVEYEKLLKKSYTENFEDLLKTDLLKVIGKDAYGSFIVVLVPCFIMTNGIDPEKTLRYAIYRLDSIVKEKYVLILCETHSNWLSDTVFMYAKQWYDILPKVYKKNLKKLYLLHGGFFSKTFLTMMSPFISEKFWKKLEYIEKLEDLFIKLNIDGANNLKHFPYIVQRNEELLLGVDTISFFGADLEILCQRFGRSFMGFKNIPSLLVTFIDHLLKPEIINTKDLFNLQTDSATLYEIVGDIENGEPTTDFNNIPALVCSFRLFLDTQKYGLLGKEACASLLQIRNSSSTKILKYTMAKLFERLQLGSQQCILCLLHFFQKVTEHAEQNNMTAKALSVIFSPSFFRSRKPLTNYQEGIPLANKCLMMLIQDSSILTNNNMKDLEESDEVSSVSSEEKKTVSSTRHRSVRDVEESSESDSSDSNSETTDSSDDSNDTKKEVNRKSKNIHASSANKKDLKKSGTMRLSNESANHNDMDLFIKRNEKLSTDYDRNTNRRTSTNVNTSDKDNISIEGYGTQNSENSLASNLNNYSEKSQDGKEGSSKTKSLATVTRMISKAFVSMKSNLKNSSNSRLDISKKDSNSNASVNEKSAVTDKGSNELMKDPLRQSHTMVRNNNLIYSKVISRKLTEKKDIDTETESGSDYDLVSSSSSDSSSVPTRQNRSGSNQDVKREPGKKGHDKVNLNASSNRKTDSILSNQNTKNTSQKNNNNNKIKKDSLNKKVSKEATGSSITNSSGSSYSEDTDSNESNSVASDGTSSGSSYNDTSDSSNKQK